MDENTEKEAAINGCSETSLLKKRQSSENSSGDNVLANVAETTN